MMRVSMATVAAPAVGAYRAQSPPRRSGEGNSRGAAATVNLSEAGRALALESGTTGASPSSDGASQRPMTALDPTLTTRAGILEQSLGVPVRLPDPDTSTPRAKIGLSDGVDLELATVAQDGPPTPGAFQARGVLRTEQGKPVGFDLVVEVEGQQAQTQSFKSQDPKATHIDPALVTLGQVAAQAYGPVFSFEVAEMGGAAGDPGTLAGKR